MFQRKGIVVALKHDVRLGGDYRIASTPTNTAPHYSYFLSHYMRSANYYVTHRDDAISTDWQCTNLFLHINVDAGSLAPGDLLENVINMEFTLK